MKAQIHSIDDSYYGIWWSDKTFNDLVETRKKLMEWINKQQVINGNEFLDFCVDLGANEATREYN